MSVQHSNKHMSRMMYLHHLDPGSRVQTREAAAVKIRQRFFCWPGIADTVNNTMNPNAVIIPGLIVLFTLLYIVYSNLKPVLDSLSF